MRDLGDRDTPVKRPSPIAREAAQQGARHGAAIQRFAKAATVADYAGSTGRCWLTHPAKDSKLVQDVFGEVHILSAAQLDVALFRRLEAA